MKKKNKILLALGILLGVAAFMGLLLHIVLGQGKFEKAGYIYERGYAINEEELDRVFSEEAESVSGNLFEDGEDYYSNTAHEGRVYLGEEHLYTGGTPYFIQEYEGEALGGLYFYDYNARLIAWDWTVETGYPGLYLVDGKTYNYGMTEADWEDFCLVRSGKYLYTATELTVNTPSPVAIPAYSAVELDEGSIKWVTCEDGIFTLHSAEVADSILVSNGVYSVDYSALRNNANAK